MFDYVVVVVSDDLEIKKLALKEEVLQSSIFVPVSESAWNGAAGNGLGTLFAIENASNAIGKDLVEEVKRGKSALIVHTAGEGTRNILTRTCKNKSFIAVATLTILEGVIKQFQAFAIPSRILVTWGDQFLLFADRADEIRQCAQSTHVMLFGLKTKLTEEIARNYGIQIVRCVEGKGCELLEFDDSRTYEVAKKWAQKRRSDVMVNLGMFAMSGIAAERMLDAFATNLRERKGKFNSDALWQLWISSESKADSWLRERADRIKRALVRAEPLIRSFPLSEKTAWLDFGTNECYTTNVLKILDEDDAGMQLRRFLGLDVATVKNGCEVLHSVYENAEFEDGCVKRSVTVNTKAKHAQLEEACVINSRLNRIQGKNCVVYNVVDHASLVVNDCVLVDVFHPGKGRIRLKMRIGAEKGAKKEWWSTRLPGNEFSLREIAAMMQDVSEDEVNDTKKKYACIVDAIISDADTLKTALERPLKIEPFVEDKPWGYERWCASPRNYCAIELGEKQEFTLDELTSLFTEQMLGAKQAGEKKFPLIVKIIKADENLSVQVHPDDAYARTLGDVFGKEEAWHVLQAAAGAKIHLGFADVMNAARFKERVKRVEFLSCVHAFDATVGDTYHIPAGVIHALGAGTKVYEVSTASERTFRIHDYGRGRELHLDDAVAVLRFEEGGALKQEHTLLRTEHGFAEYMLLRGEQFDVRLFSGHGAITIFTAGSVCLLTCLRGDVTVKTSMRGAELSLSAMDTVLVPACVEKFDMHGEGAVLCAVSSRVF
jgi:mannose-6-phosphate isomerase